jgi:hypothetical protein
MTIFLWSVTRAASDEFCGIKPQALKQNHRLADFLQSQVQTGVWENFPSHVTLHDSSKRHRVGSAPTFYCTRAEGDRDQRGHIAQFAQ